jgi:transcriptional regulator with XRE-family HTH domain
MGQCSRVPFAWGTKHAEQERRAPYVGPRAARGHVIKYFVAYFANFANIRHMPISFAEFVRLRRRECGLTQRQVAEALGLKSIAFLSDIEAGNRKPAQTLMPALAGVLRTDVETLRSYDIRSPLAEVRTLLKAHPEYAVAFRRVIEHSKQLGADEVLRRIESPHSSGEDAADQAERPHRRQRSKEPPPAETGTLGI